MFLDQSVFNDETTLMDSARSSAYTTRPNLSRGIPSTPRLTPLAVVSPDAPYSTIANLRFPVDLVHAQAAEYTDEARAHGAPHSMQLWRKGCHEALLSLARAATATPAHANCEALFWQIEGEEYHVSVTFSQVRRATAH